MALERFFIEENSIINALVLDHSLSPVPFRQSLVSPVDMTEIETRLDHQLSANHTLVGRFFIEKRNMKNTGLDTFTLPSMAVTRENTETALQLTETAMIGPSAVNEIRFQYAGTQLPAGPTAPPR